MSLLRLDVDDRQAVMTTEGAVCAGTQELVESATFARVLDLYVDHLEAHNPTALDELGLSVEESPSAAAGVAGGPAGDAGSRGDLLGCGTEIGAFVRLDDLQQGYAFGQLDRSIIMSPNRVNARVVLPVASLDDVLRGYPVDYLLYANNYEAIDDEHPVLERLADREAALTVFREGAAMSKGTTTSTGLTNSYFANPFGPAQRREQHETLAEKTFAAAYAAGVYVGQLRTQLGLPGYETDGPRVAAEALLDLIAAGASPAGPARPEEGSDRP